MMARITPAVAFAVLTLMACARSEEQATAPAGDTAPAAEQMTAPPDAAAQPAAEVVHPCSLLTQADWDAVLGPGAAAEQANDESCKGKKSLVGEFEVILRRPEDMARQIAEDRQYALQPPVATLTGLGDEAYQSGNGNMVIMRKGDHYVRVSGAGIAKAAPKPAAEATRFLAERVAAKL